ncbi:MAG: DUF354 domain-containing protein [Candidatus Methanodesulfokora sp.]
MLIWLDALTPKQARLMAEIAEFLEKRGENILITCRRYAETEQMLEIKGLSYISIGGYGESRLEKLVNYADRMIKLIEIVRERKPDILISFSSPEATRVAFGLGIKAVTINDTPHAFHVCRLTFPLSWRIIHPAAVPEELYLMNWACKESLVSYNGVDEVAWMRKAKPKEEELEKLGIKGDFVIIRPEESKASYLRDETDISTIIDVAVKMGYYVILMPRYEDQREYYSRKYGSSVKIPSYPPDAPSIYFFSSLVVTGGGTMSREAALAGTPSISIFPLNVPLYVNDYLSKMGYPLWRFYSARDAVPLVKEILSSPNRYKKDVRDLVKQLESPVEAVERVMSCQA